MILNIPIVTFCIHTTSAFQLSCLKLSLQISYNFIVEILTKILPFQTKKFNIHTRFQHFSQSSFPIICKNKIKTSLPAKQPQKITLTKFTLFDHVISPLGFSKAKHSQSHHMMHDEPTQFHTLPGGFGDNSIVDPFPHRGQKQSLSHCQRLLYRDQNTTFDTKQFTQ